MIQAIATLIGLQLLGEMLVAGFGLPLRRTLDGIATALPMPVAVVCLPCIGWL
ncbi:hypothetical protein [Variovorax sp. LT1R16]|uniref:hypothetical protein n=1 Tax=Variovorax sp. LT1R16 TaxID=3443728 RepID=UPI003F47840F